MASTRLLNFPGREILETVGQLAVCSLSSGTRKMESEISHGKRRSILIKRLRTAGVCLSSMPATSRT